MKLEKLSLVEFARLGNILGKELLLGVDGADDGTEVTVIVNGFCVGL